MSTFQNFRVIFFNENIMIHLNIQLIQSALEQTDWNISAAARKLNILTSYLTFQQDQ
ncbi:helix-turn-helix domain-containing protein [Sporosarcina sp.]|uniref:helix-turn-helix domain-containing protein n=1 Tax=Sporosarcina sp. TaxID=49982 RepID=UPI00345BA274